MAREVCRRSFLQGSALTTAGAAMAGASSAFVGQTAEALAAGLTDNRVKRTLQIELRTALPGALR